MSPNANSNNLDDHSLGMDCAISRRDFLNATLLASGGLLLTGASPLDLMASREEWNGYGGVGDYRTSNGNTYEVMTSGHGIRDGIYEGKNLKKVDTGEQFDCVIVGGGISGLAAALFFQRQAEEKKSCLVLDNHPIFGGEAKRNEFVVNGQRLIVHQASAMCFPPIPNSFLAQFYDSIGVDFSKFQYQTWGGERPEIAVGNTPYVDDGKNCGFYFRAHPGTQPGVWIVDPYGTQFRNAPIPQQAKRELLSMQGGPGRTQDIPRKDGDAVARHVDAMTLEQHLIERYGISRETIRGYLSPVTGGGSGIGPDVLSGYVEYAPDLVFPWNQQQGEQMFPGGNTGMARHMMKALIPGSLSGDRTMEAICRARVNFRALDRAGQAARVRLNVTVIAVEHDGPSEKAGSVTVTYGQDEKLYSVKARSVVMAGGSWTTKHIVRDLPREYQDAFAHFHRAPCLMANVAVRNWRFLAKLGISQCQWFEGIGNYTAVRKIATFGAPSPTLSPDSPTVLTLKILYSQPGLTLAEQVQRGRMALFATSYRDYERKIREQFTEMFAQAGFNPRRDIAGIILNRWGHAYLSPQPGFFFGLAGKPAPRELVRRAPFGRIAFANSDLAGIMDHRASIIEAQRAVQQLA